MTHHQIEKFALGDLVINAIISIIAGWHTHWWVGLMIFSFFNEFSLIARSLMAIAENNLDDHTNITTVHKPEVLP